MLFPFGTMQELWHLPNLNPGASASAPIAVVFLTRASAAERAALLSDLDGPGGEAALPGRPAAAPPPRVLAGVPWVRRSVPDTGRAVYEVMSGQFRGAAVFADAETMRERAGGGPGTVVVAASGRGAAPDEPIRELLQAARVDVRRAKPLLSRVLDAAMAETLADVMPDYAARKIDFPAEWALERVRRFQFKTNPESLGDGDQEFLHVCPAHLPVDLELSAEEPTLVSLVHLEDAEIAQLKKTISGGTAPQPKDVRILNWPAAKEPGTWDEMHRIFGAIRPPFPDGVYERYALFVDRSEPEGSGRGDVEILLVQQMRDRHTNRPDTNLEVAKLNKAESTLDVWRAMFDRSRSGERGGEGQSQRFGRDDVSWLRNLPDPDRITVSDDYDGCYVFLLCPMSKAQVQRVREELGREWGMQLMDVSRHVATPDIAGLVGLLESAEFRKYSDPPGQFIAVDKETLDHSDGLCIIAEVDLRFYEGNGGRSIGHDHLGYGWGRACYEDAVSMWVNYSVANMSLEEDLEDSIQYAYWSDVLIDEVRKLNDQQDGDGGKEAEEEGGDEEEEDEEQ
ncbi:hypothetical protein GGS23DRAFT_620529 [Durotheca rogersii]|uniref:uncharacterized protein n=1 Tax=Durotheca rogersii TaxID=419775 RepID=UPI00222016BD|nr:uncharacterized protein GGS23DRAFT_620529 [Durotheca rogersii]KAI5863716.1 hypothetical protein GGS23DRAFT_620529 [Durotheca rogersii]